MEQLPSIDSKGISPNDLRGNMKEKGIRGRKPTLEKFLRLLNRYGMDDPRTKKIFSRFTFFQMASVKDHPDFIMILEAIVIRSLIQGKKLSTSERWALKYLRQSKARKREGFDPYEDGFMKHFDARTPQKVKVIADDGKPMREDA